jgi:hypothetical protein
MNLAAVWNDLWQGDFAHIWYGITHAHWANVWAAFSAMFTVLAVIVAGWAMFRWRKQDELKAKQAFKVAIADYAFAIAPIALAQKDGKSIDKELKVEYRNKFFAAHHAWLLCEGLLDKNKYIKECWDFIEENHKHLMSEDLSAEILGAHCMGILKTHFLFK